MSVCNRCESFGLQFNRKYAPEDFFASKPGCETWIIGLNPKDDGHGEDKRSKEELAKYFSSHDVHPYFNDFKKVSKQLYSGIMSGNVAHTDVVKCIGKKWPPVSVSPSGVRMILENCSFYLKNQILTHAPRMLICNGAAVCAVVKSIVKPVYDDGMSTNYRGKIGENEIHVVLSGFIGRIDDYAKRRLGREIEAVAVDVGISW